MPQGSTDYTRLQDLLAAGKWKEADHETGRVMLVVAKQESWLRFQDIDDFPCTDLSIIDRLWVKYSNGHFGFSIQRRIYQSLGGTKEYKAEIVKEYDVEIWGTFANAVGWRKEDWN
ncbi:MAG: GUN4 domain-containing protein [Nostoc sp. ChiSLP02]|nr:GUN4 domain-containing protein [Nostoc sp. DedSLP05]MDZ8103026.1 GUN4 domain-containing protein [Nostoc sp. DedSLP01]MDZ8183417.1 GUN4 domain-containing protein [Nostoc sp. ChiSLP02]